MSSTTQSNEYYSYASKDASFKDFKLIKEDLKVDLGKNEVLLKIKAVSLNFRDYVMAENKYPIPRKENLIPGSDASAEIVKVGANVSDLQVGDRVITNFDPKHLYGIYKDHKNDYGCLVDGVLTRYKVVTDSSVNKLPKDCHLTDEEAATLVASGVTSWNALFGSSDKFIAGQSVLMLGTGGVSIATLILAKAAGAVTIITSSSDEKLKYVKEKWGVDYTINYNKYPDWEKKVLEYTNGEGVDFVLETGGNTTIVKSLESTKIGGQVLDIGFIGGDAKETPEILTTILFRAITLRGILVGSKQLAEQLIRFVDAKKLRFPIDKVFGFSPDQVKAAYENVANQSTIGKTVIKLD